MKQQLSRHHIATERLCQTNAKITKHQQRSSTTRACIRTCSYVGGVPPLKFGSDHFAEELETGFRALRTELNVPVSFPLSVSQAADSSAARGPIPPPNGVEDVTDRTDLPFVTIDPPGSIDLDQAFYAERTASGYQVFYAIADVAAFVGPGSALDVEAMQRGVTLYSPDQRASLHPEPINEAAASLLAGATRQAVLWQIELDKRGVQVGAHAARATVKSREQLTYAQAQDRLDTDSANEPLMLLREIGQLRQQLEAERGAISLQLPSQEITQQADGAYKLHYDTSMPIEGWNAQISLLTGMAAGQLMVEAGHGLLRTLPPLQSDTVDQVRRAAKALNVDWPDGMSYADRVRELDPNVAAEAALLTRAARSFRGAGYDAFFNGKTPEQPLHGAIGAIYAHVTAPLRRVCDRYANEIILSHCAGIETPEWVLAQLDQLPSIMNTGRQRDRSLERATVDFVEAMVLRHRVGEVFDGVVLSHTRRGANVQLREPAVLATIDDRADIGAEVQLRLDKVDVSRRTVDFSIAS